MSKTAKQILQEARELISDERRWTVEEFARNDCGERVSEFGDEAVCFCAVGAINRKTDKTNNGIAARAALRNVVGTSIYRYNDTHSHAEVLAAFDAAIASLGDA